MPRSRACSPAGVLGLSSEATSVKGRTGLGGDGMTGKGGKTSPALPASHSRGKRGREVIAIRRGRRLPLSLVLLLAASLAVPGGCSTSPERRDAETTEVPVYSYVVEAEYPHDTGDFTQGLCLVDGELYEGTGLWGRSRLTRSEFPGGRVLGSVSLAPEYFGEGVTVMGDEVFQLTYTSHLCFVYDRESLELRRTFSYPTEGWGLTHDGKSLIMSDGSSTLYYLDPRSGEELGRVEVTDAGGPVADLNELEYAAGMIYANIWKTDRIAVISPESGAVRAWIDLTGLNPEPERLVDPYVLNGIAYDEGSGGLLVTGKCWPRLYLISLRRG